MTGVSGSASASYSLNALGQRVKKVASSVTTYFVYDDAGHLIGEYDGSGNLVQETVWMEDTPVATLRPNGGSISIFYVHSDHLNTPRRISRPSDNAIVWRWDSDPFGTDAASEDPDADTNPFKYGLRFPGQYFDAETGLNYNYFRDYDAAMGRYAQSDPEGLGDGPNTYAYVASSPLVAIDPSGRWLFIPFVCAAGGCEAAAGAAAAALGIGMFMSTEQGQDLAKTVAQELARQKDCECRETKTRTQAMIEAYAFAGIPVGGGPGFNPLPWKPDFRFPKGMSPRDRAWADFQRRYNEPNYGWSSPSGAQVQEHPFGHPEFPGPEHHKCPHFHARNAAGIDSPPITYMPGSP